MSKLKLSLAQGGPPPIGPDPHTLEMHVGAGRRYDPSRDVIVFMPPMLAGVVRTFQERALPALVERMEAPGTDTRIGMCILAMFQGFKKANIDKSLYESFVDTWMKTCDDPEAIDLVLKVLGRAILQFYVECTLNTQLEEGDRWPCPMDQVIDRCLEAAPYERRKGLLCRIFRKCRNAVRWSTSFLRSGSSSSRSVTAWESAAPSSTEATTPSTPKPPDSI